MLRAGSSGRSTRRRRANPDGGRVSAGRSPGEAFGTTGLVLRLAAVAVGSAEAFGDLSRAAVHVIGQATEAAASPVIIND